MRNIFLFIRSHFNFFLFVVLQIVCIYFIINYSKYHQAAFGNFANQITGKFDQRYSNVESYFQLKKTNDSLVIANEKLYNTLRENFDIPDTVSRSVVDSIRTDSLTQFRKFTYLSARIAANSVSTQSNFIVLSRGRKHQLKVGMGIVDPNSAVVGIITEVSEDYSVVMSLLHKDSHISAKLVKTGETGTLSWDGKTPNVITLNGISKGVKINKGDSIITSGFSTTFPKGMLIGRVETVFNDNASNSYIIKIRTATNFYNLQYAYAIDNAQATEVNDLLEKAGKQL